MKKIMMIGAAALAMAAIEVRAMSLAEASGQIASAVADENVMADIVGQLSHADQVAFLSRVNAAIDSKPGSPAEKAADYLKANKAAVKAAKGNRTALLAETFATVPPEALTLINERFAAELFSRNANPEAPIDDDRMTNIAVSVFEKVQARTAAADNSDVRNTFAILMLVRASEGSPADLADTLVSQMDDPAAREQAKTEWLPAALGQGQPKSYEPLLGASDAGDQPDFLAVAHIAKPETPVALLADLDGAPGDIATVKATLGPGFASLPDSIGDGAGLTRVPKSVDPSDKWFGGLRRGEAPSEPHGYSGQRIYE
ncbi:MAG: hypothetical protein J6U17_03060 [Kiritimatiellae bacterium]|nr:hypothetical protein [Kiritimatiellia bacterium]